MWTRTRADGNSGTSHDNKRNHHSTHNFACRVWLKPTFLESPVIMSRCSRRFLLQHWFKAFLHTVSRLLKIFQQLFHQKTLCFPTVLHIILYGRAINISAHYRVAKRRVIAAGQMSTTALLHFCFNAEQQKWLAALLFNAVYLANQSYGKTTHRTLQCTEVSGVLNAWSE